jgi:hypothetical protein
MQPGGEERNEYRHLFLWLVQYGTRGKIHCCKNFSVTFLNPRFLCLPSTEHFSMFPLRAIMCDGPESQSQKMCFLLSFFLYLSLPPR